MTSWFFVFFLIPQNEKGNQEENSSQIAICHRSSRRPLFGRGRFTTANPEEASQTHPTAPLFLFHRRRRRNTRFAPVAVRVQSIIAADSPVGQLRSRFVHRRGCVYRCFVDSRRQVAGGVCAGGCGGCGCEAGAVGCASCTGG